MSNKDNLRVLNTEKGKRVEKVELPWMKLFLMGAALSLGGAGAIELAKYLLKKGKSDPASAGNPMPMMGPAGAPPALPGAVSPNVFQNPYAQMQAMQGFPAPFQNPMVVPEADEPPKWFNAFKEQYDKDQQRLSTLEQSAQRTSAGRATNLADDDDEYEDAE